jgi:hypothetical protein
MKTKTLTTSFILISFFIIGQVPQICFNPYVNYIDGGSGSRTLCNSDFNGDGLIDLAVANYSSNNVSILFGNGNGQFSLQTNYLVGNSPVKIVSADFNGDNLMDLAVANAGSNNLSILLNIGSGIFSTPINYTLTSSPMTIATSDLDGDNKADIILKSMGTYQNLVFLKGNGNGTFAVNSAYNIAYGPKSSVNISDYNNDGKPDFSVTSYQSILVFINNGLGNFYPSVTYTISADPTAIINSNDFNGDGKVDLIVSTESSGSGTIYVSHYILLGTGTGTFGTKVLFFQSSSGSCNSVNSNDFNNDGKTDLILSTNSTSAILLLGNGTGTFNGPINNNLPALFEISASDFNNDGYIDLACAINNLTGSVSILINGGFLQPLLVNSGTICAGKSFTILPTGAITYTYSSGSAIVTPTVNTAYTVTGTATNGCTNTAVSSVTVNALPSVSVSSGAICAGQSFTMIPSGANTYSYSSGNAIVTPTSNTNYTVTGTGVNSCSNSAVSSVTVNAIPIISVNSGSICNGQSFTMIPSGANTFSYSSGFQTVNPSTNTSYSVSGTSIYGCISNTVAISSVTVNPLPIVSVNSGSICSGQSFTMTPSGANTYTYSSGSAVVSPTTNTTYSVAGTNLQGCSSNSVLSTISVYALPVLTTSTSNTLLCSGHTSTLSVSGANSYTWISNSNTSTIAISPTVTTTYTVEGIDVNGCMNSSTITQSVSLCTNLSNVTFNNLTINIYPNPVDDFLNIDFKEINNNVITIQLVNTLGQVLIEEKTKNESVTLNLTNIVNGIYFIKVMENEKVLAFKKIVKQ